MKPTNNFRLATAYCCCVAIILALGAAFAVNSEPATRSDPDRYYHYAISEITAKEFAPQTVPQVEGLGWNKFFAEKEFLFHVFTGAGYRVFNEKGVLIACMTMGVLVILSIFWLNAQVLSPFLALIPTLFIVLASSKFLIRIFSVRPQILAVLFAVLLLGAILRRRQRLAGIFALCFTLSYHAVYIPVALAVIACFSGLVVDRNLSGKLFRQNLKCLLFTVAGITIGLLVNPYFPSNILMGLQHLKIALLSTGLPIHHFGVELLSATGSSLLMHLAGFFVLATIGLLFLGYYSYPYFTSIKAGGGNDSDREARFEALTAFCCFTLFLVITVHSPRGNEYLIPFASLFIARLVQLVVHKKVALVSLSLGVLLLQIPDSKLALGSLAESRLFFQPEIEPVNANKALERVPKDQKKNRVFNCNWDVSPFLLYSRPDLVFVDILDPSFLHSRNPEFYSLRYQWFHGEVADSYGLLKESFNADYLFCTNLPISNQLKSDPHFDILFPKTFIESLGSEFTVFALKQERLPQFVRQFHYTKTLIPPNGDVSTETPGLWPVNVPDSAVPPVFIDLKGISSPKNVQDEEIVCSDIYPTQVEIERLAGASMVGLGGGPHLQLSVNDKLIYANVKFSGIRGMIHSIVKLEEPLTKETQIRLRVCGLNQRTYLGAALSLWSPESLKEICLTRYSENTDFVPESKSNYLERSEIECLAPIVTHN